MVLASRSRCAVLAMTLSVGACGGDESTPAPPGVAPLEASLAERPRAASGQRCPEAINLVTGERDATDPRTMVRERYEYAHGRGCVHGTLAAVWAALRDPEVTVDRRRVSEFMVTRDTEPEYPISFRVHHIIRDIVTLEFDSSYRLAPLVGTVESPREVVLWYQKTFGTSFITILRGTVVARPLDDETVELEHVRHIKSSGAGAEDARTYLDDTFNSVVARVHGRPLPRY
jgi:hypothetical protein